MGRMLQAIIKDQETNGRSHRLSGAQQRKQQIARIGKEWDVRVTLTDSYTTGDVLKYVRDGRHELLWCLIGGAEHGHSKQEAREGVPIVIEEDGTAVFDHDHHHVCLVFYEDHTYDQVLNFVHKKRGEGIYAVVRNPNYTYMGWKIHAMKPQTKICADDTVVCEFGTMPIDDDTDENRGKILYMVKKYGDDMTKVKYGIFPRSDYGQAMKRKRVNPLNQVLKKQKIIDKLKLKLALAEQDMQQSLIGGYSPEGEDSDDDEE